MISHSQMRDSYVLISRAKEYVGAPSDMCRQKLQLYRPILDVNLIRRGGGGGVVRGPDEQTQSCQSETFYSMMPKLCELYFFSI